MSEHIKYQIGLKKSNNVHYATINDVSNVVTDFDHFPYTRFYRGVYYYSKPRIIEREAGWRPQQNEYYVPNLFIEPSEYPNHCFQSACSTTFPCHHHKKHSDRHKLCKEFNKSCIVKYR